MIHEALFVLLVIAAPVLIGAFVCDRVEKGRQRRRNVIPAYWR